MYNHLSNVFMKQVHEDPPSSKQESVVNYFWRAMRFIAPLFKIQKEY